MDMVRSYLLPSKLYEARGSPVHKAIPPELHSLESTYRVYPGFHLYVSIVSSDNRSSRWLTIGSNALREQKPGISPYIWHQGYAAGAK